jgi:ATP-binding cassette subfamily F protein 3
MISVENISKRYGDQILFDSASFRINPREKIGLVGRNGHGKTTLFRLIAGEDQPDSGTINIPRGYRIGYLQQQIRFTEDTVRAEGARALPDEERNNIWKVEKILFGLGFAEEDMVCHPAELSGGFQVRMNLAKVLLSEPDLLLLDEPNNFLDITSIRWLIRFLVTWKGEMMLITHDRNFMDSVVTHTMGIHRMKVRRIEGNTGKLYDQIAQEEEIYEKTRINDEQRRREIEQFVSRFRAKARLANLVQSRIKMLNKMDKREKLASLKELDFSFASKPFHGKHVMQLHGVTFSYEESNPLINELSINIGARDRICVIGKNGKGKTTLLKLMAGVLTPLSGSIDNSQNTVLGYYEQSNVKTLVGTRMIFEEILNAHPDVDRQRAWDICGVMMFEGEHARKRIEVLSGGEKSRVLLGRILVSPINLLVLDEPTNHLDMESCDALLTALDNFDGTVVMVTHNEMFLNALAERLIVFQGDRVSVYEGSYERFLETVGWQDEGEIIGEMYRIAERSSEEKRISKKELRRRRSEIINERSRILSPLEKRIAEIEDSIESHEEELSNLNEAMIEVSQVQDGSRISELSRSIHRCRTRIDSLFDELEKMTGTYEKYYSDFEILLSELK